MKALSTLAVLALGAAVLAVSCQKSVIEQEPVQTGTRTFKCVIATPDTKVAVSDAGKSTWEVGDEILVHGAGSSNRIVVTLTEDDISEDGKTATITVEGVEPYDRSDKGYTSTYYACYPASAVVSGNLYYYARFEETNHLLMAAYNVEDEFVFYNLCGVISFKVSGDFDNYEFYGNNGETVGYSHYQVQLAATEGDPHLNFYKTSDPGTSGPLKKITGTVTADGETVNYVGIPMGADLTKGFTFRFKDGEEVVQLAVSTAPVTLERNNLLALGDITDHLETYIPPETSDHKSEIPTDGAIDLSADGSANCYVISAPGIYKLPALKGNSEDLAGNVFGAEILWETYNNAEEVEENSVIAAVDFEDNWLYIQTPETLKPGNALIAARGSNDAIIWSWHIWIPKTAFTTNSYDGLFDAVAMSRNLGALVDAAGSNEKEESVESCGLLYQWGRKDPFPGVGVMASSTSAATTSKPLAEKSKVQITIAESIANPTMFAYDAENAADPIYKGMSWSTDETDFAWGDEDTKGMYDPCPPGYRVPAFNEGLPGWSTDDWTLDLTHFWFKKSGAVFPYAGYRDDCGGSWTHASDRSAFWSATSKDHDTARSLDIRSSVSQKSQYKSRGNSVRCVKEAAE